MPSKRISFHDFDSRLWLSGGRDQIPQNALRRASGVAPELTRSVQSRWGSSSLAGITAISTYQFAGIRYAYDGTHLYSDQGTNTWAIVTFGGGGAITWNGSKLTFAVMPPQPGLPDYLFIIGGGNAIKIAPALVGGHTPPVAQQVTQWGINAPQDGITASLGAQEDIVIDDFESSAASYTNHPGCSVSDDSTDPFAGSDCLKIDLAGAGTPAHITRAYSTNLQIYGDGTISLPTDIISFYFKCKKPSAIGWLWITFNIGSGSISSTTWHDYYRLVVQIVQTTNQHNAAGAQVTVTPAAGQWIQIAAPKSAFTKAGTHTELDWSDVNFLRFNFGDLGDATPTTCFLDDCEMFGGFPLGAGPAALLGGSQYRYYVTYGNNTTGSDSNPNGMQLKADGTVSTPDPAVVGGVAVQPVVINNIPVSSDGQVGNRKLWRTTAGGIEAFYLDTIPDNSTTTYTDTRGDLPGQPIILTPWTKSVAFVIGDYVDGGNGYYFIVSGVTGDAKSGATIPNWNIPTGPFLGFWTPITYYLVGNWVSFGGIGYVCIANAQGTTQSPSNASFWTALGTTSDNHVTWTWAGLNEVPHLGDQILLLDNAPPQTTYGDAVGPFQGSMFWCRDSTPGRRGWTYSSPPGRPESVANQFAPTSDDDPTQKQVIFDYTLWLITTKIAFQADGENPAINYNPIMYATGTSNPFSVAAGQEGIYYQASDGIRVINRAGSFLPGFDNIAPIERGQTEENVAAFTATIAAYCRNEIIFSNGTVSFGLSRTSQGYVWRMVGMGFGALYYERNDDEILASWSTITGLWENPGFYQDAGTPIAFEIQTPSQLLDEGQVAVIRRIFIDVNGRVNALQPIQTLTPVALTDLGQTTLADIKVNGRQTVEIAFQAPARQFSLRLTGSLANRIELFGVELDCAVTGAEITQAAG